MEVVMASREHLAAMLARTAISFGKCRTWGQKPGKLRASRRTTSRFSGAKEKKDSLKMNERRGNVYENKGSVFHKRGQSGNATENKGSYALRAGMLLKTKYVSPKLSGIPSCCVTSYPMTAGHGNNHEGPVSVGLNPPFRTRGEKSALATQQAGDLFGIVGQDDIRTGPSD
jgi:hypothetical protein